MSKNQSTTCIYVFPREYIYLTNKMWYISFILKAQDKCYNYTFWIFELLKTHSICDVRLWSSNTAKPIYVIYEYRCVLFQTTDICDTSWQTDTCTNTVYTRFHKDSSDFSPTLFHSIGCENGCRLLYAYVILIIFGFVPLSVYLRNHPSEANQVISRGYKNQVVHSLELTWPLKIGHPKRKLVFQPSISRCENVSFREGIGLGNGDWFHQVYW